MSIPCSGTATAPPSAGEAWQALLRGRAGRLWAAVCSPHGQRRLAWLLTLALVLIDIFFVGRHALVRYHSYRADAFDLGNMDQAVWNTLHGNPFRFTNRGLDWFGPPTRLGVHVEPILLLIAPLYLIHNGPTTLIVLQTVALALGAVPLFLLGLRHLPRMPLVATTFVAAYLLTPELLGEALYDFHAVALATPLLLVALWALDTRRLGWFLVAAVLAAMCKEDVALSLVPLGLWVALRMGRPRLGGAIALVALAWVAFCFGVVLPHFNQGVTGSNNFWYRYSWLGGSAQQAIRNSIRNPLLPLSVLADSERRRYLAILLRTGGGAGIFAPALWICALPDLAVNLLSAHDEQYSAFYQYNAVLLPYLMTASILGVSTLYRARRRAELARRLGAHLTSRPSSLGGRFFLAWQGRTLFAWANVWQQRLSAGHQRLIGRLPVPSRLIGPLIALLLLTTGWWNLVATDPHVQDFWTSGSQPWSSQHEVDQLLATIPRSAVVAATDTLDPHLSDRRTIYLLPDPQAYEADYIAFDLADAISESQEADFEMVRTMLASRRYLIVGTVESVTLLERIGPPLSSLAVIGPDTQPVRTHAPPHRQRATARQPRPIGDTVKRRGTVQRAF